METTKSKLKTVTMGELGSCLPVGIREGDSLNKTLSTLPYKVAQEKELAKLKARGNATFLEYITTALALLLDHFGPHKIQTLGMPERKLVIGQAYLADVIYAYLWIRRQALGSPLAMILECPRCKLPDGSNVKTPSTADLDTLRVRVIENVKTLKWCVELRDGVKFNGKVSKTIHLGPAIWQYLNPELGSLADSLQILNLFRASIVGVDGVEGVPVLMESDSDEMTRYDLAVTERALGETLPGPELIYEGQCSECKRNLIAPIRWMDESFFSLASLPDPKKS